jgi:hypothetical protein
MTSIHPIFRAHSTPDPDAVPPRDPTPNPDDVPPPTNAPVEEPTLPEPPIRAALSMVQQRAIRYQRRHQGRPGDAS